MFSDTLTGKNLWKICVTLLLETMSLREMGPQLKLPIKVTKGSLPLPYATLMGNFNWGPISRNENTNQTLFVVRWITTYITLAMNSYLPT